MPQPRRAPTALQSVLNSIARTAARLCDARDTRISLVEDGGFRIAAFAGTIPLLLKAGEVHALDRHTPQGHATLDRRVIHIRDMQIAARQRYPPFAAIARATGMRTVLVAPLIRGSNVLGTILIRRDRVKAFTAKQIALLKAFADQAAIAIENARLSEQLEARNRDLTEALEQQTATAEILAVISGSPIDIQPVFTAMAESTARLCDSPDVSIFRVDGNVLNLVVHRGPLPSVAPLGTERISLERGTVVGRSVIERRTIQVADLMSETQEYPEGSARARRFETRAVLCVPLLRENVAIGAIAVRRTEARLFSERQIALLKTFADQAVIAIENVRLFTELEARNRELTESLDRQTATSEILRIISQSQMDVRPVFDAIARSAVRLCGAEYGGVYRVDGEFIHSVAHDGFTPEQLEHWRSTWPRPITASGVNAEAIKSRSVVRIADVEAESGIELTPETRANLRSRGARSILAVPMLRQDQVIGTISLAHRMVDAFPESHVELLKTFADQAVIAIENVRLFAELQARNRSLTEALEQQTATSEILRVISQSPTDVRPVFGAIIGNAVRLCGGVYGIAWRYSEGLVHVGAVHNLSPSDEKELRERFPRPFADSDHVHRRMQSGRMIDVPDIEQATDLPATLVASLRRRNARSVVIVPMQRDNEVVGAIGVSHLDVGAFSASRIELLKTLADQAVIAIENVRLFTELEERNAALSEALERQTATSDILKVISSSRTEVQPVLDAIARSSARLCDAHDTIVIRLSPRGCHVVANYGPVPAPDPNQIVPYTRGTPAGRAMLERRTVHLHDLAAVLDDYSDSTVFVERFGTRTIVVAPLLREGEPIGCIAIRRQDVRPFSESQIALLQTFAEQAVIAIENVRLFNELEARNRALTEALDQQTATGDILRVISSSPTDVQPVFDAIAASAVRLCDGVLSAVFQFDGELIHFVASAYTNKEGRVAPPASGSWLAAMKRVYPAAPDRSTTIGTQTILERRVIHVADVEHDPSVPDGTRLLGRAVGFRALVSVPMLREGHAVGAIQVGRRDPVAYSDTQIELLQTFADQAVIAIENVRLFTELQARTQELTNSVKQLTALGEVGQAVSSTLDLETVLTTIASRASQLAGTETCTVYEYDEDAEEFHLRATHNVDERVLALTRVRPIRKGEGVTGRVASTRAPVQVEDVAREDAYQDPLRAALLSARVRSVLAIPLLRETRLIGVLIVSRTTPGRFADEVITLLQTFATQSAIAIQNARLFREIEAKSRELEVASRHKSAFLANMSHELRTPMNAILGYTELIADGIYGGVPEPMRDVLTRVDASGRHLLGLINDVLDLSKIEAGQLTLTLAEYSMKEVVDAVVAAVGALAAEKRLRLVVDLAPELPTGRGDQRRLAQVLLNLVGNALKFTEQGEIAVRVGAAAGLFTVAVSDTGPGIAAADQERIFEEFQQADTSTTRPKGGTGLGLAIARRIVALHGGRIWVESVTGEGATFRFTIPVRVEQQAVAREAARS